MRFSYMIPFLIVILFIFGCGRAPNGEEGNIYYNKGSIGLEMKVVNGMPPSILYAGDRLTIGVELKNLGTSPIENGLLFIEGYDRNLIPSNGPGTPLPGYAGDGFAIAEHRTQYNDAGGYLYKDFQSGQISLPPDTPRYPFDLTLYACYLYRTKTSATICFDPQPHRDYTDKPCRTMPVSLGSQGAPVAITNVQVDNIGGTEVRMVFNIQNIGNGDVVDPQLALSKCPTRFNPSDYNIVRISASQMIGNTNTALECNLGSAGYVRLPMGGTGKIICTAPIGEANAAYLRSVYIELEYGYRQTLKKHIELRGN